MKHRRATIINLSILTLLLAYFAAVSRPRTDKQVPRPDSFVREWPLYRSHRISKEGLRSTVSFLNKSGYWCTFDENARDKYQPRVAFSQRHEIRALLAKNGIPSQDTLIEVKEAATPTEIAGPYFEMPGEQQEALTARQAWREHVKQELEALLFSIEGVTKVEVSFLAASCAAIIACVLSQPGDVILTETYKGKTGSSSSRSFSSVVSTIYNERQGVNGFYTGLVARLIQVGGIITSQLLLYDFIKQSLGLPATGSS